jgi:hydrogenase expression/formation protein HypC
MCLGIPMRLQHIEDGITATAETAGIERAIGIQLVPEAKAGDYVLVHAGFAIEIIDPVEAMERIRLLESFLEELV